MEVVTHMEATRIKTRAVEEATRRPRINIKAAAMEAGTEALHSLRMASSSHHMVGIHRNRQGGSKVHHRHKEVGNKGRHPRKMGGGSKGHRLSRVEVGSRDLHQSKVVGDSSRLLYSIQGMDTQDRVIRARAIVGEDIRK